MSSILVTGSSRGIGLEIVRQLLNHATPPAILIAACRKPEDAKELQALLKSHNNLHIIKLDVSDFNSLEQVASEVSGIVGNKGLTVLINNAGILTYGPDKTFDDINATSLMDLFRTNSVAPLMTIKAFLPLLKKASATHETRPIGWSRAAVVNISSVLGSVELNTTGGYWGYRESKAALNTSTRTLALELGKDGILVMAIHPGWVKTDMGTSAATLTVAESVSGILNVCYSLGPKDQGSFHQWDGKELPW